MSQTDRFSVKEAIVVVIFLAIVVGAMFYTLDEFGKEGAVKSVEISNLGDGEAERIEASVKVLSIDPVKGDLMARFEFEPTGTLLDKDGTLNEDLRVYINSANAKQETDFAKGRRMAPIEGVFNMFEGNATDYPYDKYVAELELYVTRSKPPVKKAPTSAPTPAAAATDEDEVTPVPSSSPSTAESDEDSNEIALTVDFEGSIPGYTITAAKDPKFTDETYVVTEAKIERAGTVKFFSLFVSSLMWVLSIGVLLLMVSVLVRGRKAELGMFSFMASLLFAFYAVRNSQPNVPPIGVYSDFIAFFWVEAIVAVCLIVSLLIWLFRASK